LFKKKFKVRIILPTSTLGAIHIATRTVLPSSKEKESIGILIYYVTNAEEIEAHPFPARQSALFSTYYIRRFGSMGR